MTIKLQGLETDLNINTSGWNSGIKTAIAGAATLLASIAALGVGVKKLVDITFEWAAEMDGIQDVMGGTNEQAAALNFVLRKSGVEVEQFTRGMVVLEKGLVKADGSLDTTGKKLQEFGISALDANGAVKDQAQLIGEISNKYNSFSTQQERVNFLTEIFGRSGADLIDVFDTLNAEGGIGKTTEKVKALGLAIDPGKYEQFQRNLEEVKLAGLGLAVSFVEFLMPAFEAASRWWTTTGLPAFISIRNWLQTNVPIAVETVKNVFDRLGITWENTIKPAAEELVRLWNNLEQAGLRLSPNTDEVAGKFTVLGAVIRIAVGAGMAIVQVLRAITTALEVMNRVLETGIFLWDLFHPNVPSVPSTPKVGGASGKARLNRRATGGFAIAGQSYQVNERGWTEIFTPNQGGRISNMEQKPVEAHINEVILGRIIGVEIAKALG